MPGPLAGIRVLDLTSVVSGPLATMFLADQGAEVIKIEPLGGDITRRSRQSISASGEFSALFVSSNRGKRSLALDLKRPEAAKIMRKLIASSDVLVQNFRPGTMERLGLGEPTLRELNPRLIYASISGVGESGPYAKKRVYDPIIQGLSGFADLQAEPRTRRPQMIRTIVADKTTAIFAAQAITAALFARERTGEGQHIRLAMLDTMIAYLWPEAMTQYTVVGREATTADPTARPDLIFETADGYITVGTISDSEWQGFCAASGRPGLAEDPRFNTPGGRAVNATERILLMAEIIKKRPTAEWLQRLDANDVPSAPVLRRNEVIANEQVLARELIVELDHPDIGLVRQPKPAARFDRTPARIQGPAPRIGEHSATILAELGFEAAEIERLATEKIVRLVKA
ncbi:MAG TPA: CoA transferase [Stellaceae bacterium]|jgi:crotonobetainyl-CoA:carnitine CoA-transferase CaiB-like acyl-CoA transferase|nr:CoA transferase [Stellaceae bacterium]